MVSPHSPNYPPTPTPHSLTHLLTHSLFSIKVYVRIRPLLEREREAGGNEGQNAVRVTDSTKMGKAIALTAGTKSDLFAYDFLGEEDTTQVPTPIPSFDGSCMVLTHSVVFAIATVACTPTYPLLLLLPTADTYCCY